tara:strand:+ start:1684 stop:2406 length:723 start_codon:yes stop_codon:yes gene_type:complete
LLEGERMLDVFADPDISDGAARCFGKLCKIDRGKGVSCSRGTLALMVRAGNRSVERYLRQLLDRGYVQIEKRGRKPACLTVVTKARADSGLSTPVDNSSQTDKNGGLAESQTDKNGGTSLYHIKTAFEPCTDFEPVNNTGEAVVFQKLLEAGIKEQKAAELADRFDGERIKAVVRYVEGTNPENPAGMIVAALENSYQLPAWAERDPDAPTAYDIGQAEAKARSEVLAHQSQDEGLHLGS